MPMANQKPRKKAAKAALNADLIAREALALVDDAGLESFSFRKLAARLNCEAMSIYHYYPSKSHLFDAMVDICVDETPLPPPGPPPRERLGVFLRDFRRTAVRHAGFARFLLTHRLNHRHGLAWLNGFVKIFEDAGLPPDAAARVFRNISYWVTGAALDEAAGYARGPSAAEPVPADVAANDFPFISRLGPYFQPEFHAPTFEAGLQVLLDWFDAEVAAAKARRN